MPVGLYTCRFRRRRRCAMTLKHAQALRMSVISRRLASVDSTLRSRLLRRRFCPASCLRLASYRGRSEQATGQEYAMHMSNMLLLRFFCLFNYVIGLLGQQSTRYLSRCAETSCAASSMLFKASPGSTQHWSAGRLKIALNKQNFAASQSPRARCFAKCLLVGCAAAYDKRSACSRVSHSGAAAQLRCCCYVWTTCAPWPCTGIRCTTPLVTADANCLALFTACQERAVCVVQTGKRADGSSMKLPRSSGLTHSTACLACP